MRVLLVEDHAKLALTVATGLRRLGIAVDLAFDGQDALDHVAENDYDVLVLDRDLPVVHGDDVCHAVVTGPSSCKILMLTAAGSVEQRVDGLAIGADDYLPKPFDFTELVARVRALARRSQPPIPPLLAHRDLSLDSARHRVTRNGVPLTLSPKEFAVLELLLTSPGSVVSAEQLLERAWDEAADPFTNTVKMTLSRLRSKLGDPPLIETVPKVGYRLT